MHQIQDSAEPARALAQRQSGNDEILLLWHPGGNRIELLVHDPETGAGVLVEIAPSDAIDAFYHPYVYTAESKTVVERSTTIVDV